MALGDPFVALPGGFVSLSEALDLTTASGRALAGMLAVFAEFEARHSARPGQGRDCASPPRRTASRTPRHRPPPRRRHPQAPPGRRQQKRDRQASERQPNLSPTAAGALAYKNFRFLRSPLDAVYVRRLNGAWGALTIWVWAWRCYCFGVAESGAAAFRNSGRFRCRLSSLSTSWHEG